MNAEAKFVSSVMDARLKKAKRERDSLRKQRDELINDMAETKRKAEAYDKIKEAADNEKLNGFLLYDNDSFIDKLNCVFDEMEVNHER
ncbi:hypothetical protein K4U40_00370 [Staphylococcus epidermidis]|nr:hypothetical protein [Staphylococcus epidermidis]MCG1673956.1 hypothetical protein [Staphylococcus epidermidis]MCG1700274.1 hypothetical protein [Staphylococcus epidermidis]MCG2089221.1 hypothetical protein [Staphylococcus epidermidis]MCG2308538.1 hypothetical protein [Staphylococcus epidermidis]